MKASRLSADRVRGQAKGIRAEELARPLATWVWVRVVDSELLPEGSPPGGELGARGGRHEALLPPM